MALFSLNCNFRPTHFCAFCAFLWPILERGTNRAASQSNAALMKTLFPLFAPIFLVPTLAFGQEKPPQNVLPLREVALFSSGVGYFGRAGQINGETSVPLVVHAPQIADLLKSLVLFDPKGTIKPVTYSLQDYLAQGVGETDLNLGSAASPGAILQAFQGAPVRLERAAGAIEGRILSVSSRQTKVDDALVTLEYLSLLTTMGVQTMRLDDVTSFRLLDPDLDAKLRATLEKKATNLTTKLDDGARNITLHFAGKGAREVRAGYLLETPAWKTSYRLVLDAKKKPYLQGWAIVENTTDDDWNGVHLSLISGRPISFIQDLAAPIYVSRPVVAPLILGSPRPQTFGEGFSESGQKTVNAPIAMPADELSSRVGALENRVTPPPILSDMPVNGALFRNRSAGGRGSSFGGAANEVARSSITQGLLDDKQLQAQASGAERGELFEYAIDGATTIARGQAAMVPIVSSDIEGQAVTIAESSLNPGEISTSNGFSLRNSSGLHLQGGPITVFAGGIYAGDALVSNLAPMEKRLIAYARDLEVVAIQNQPKSDENVVKISLRDGVLHFRKNLSRERSWSFKNKGDALKTVVLQVPDEGDWKLADAKQLDEKTVGAQRLRFGIKPGDTTFKAKWITQQEEEIAVFDTEAPSLDFYAQLGAVSPALKAKLVEIAAQKRRLSELAALRALKETSLKDIESDQTRIRGNMMPLDKNGQLFKSYERKLGEQESRVESVRAEIKRLREAENAASKSLRSALDGLSAD